MSSEIKIRKLLLRCYQSGMNAKRTANEIREKFAVKGYAARTCQRWYKKFRDGDFDLEEKPKHPKRKPKPKAKPPERKETYRVKLPPKEVKVEELPFQQENRSLNSRSRTGSDVVQKLIQKNRDITVSTVRRGTISRGQSNDPNAPKVKQGTIRVKEPSRLMAKRISLPLNRDARMSITKTTSYNQRRSAYAVLQPRRRVSSNGLTSRSQSRLQGGLNTDLRLPPSIAKRMATAQLSTENHTIGEGVKGAQKSSEATKKSITVQFQNVSPEVVKNTVRKSADSGQPVAKSSNPLASPKGVIYLNPQEIFGEKLNLKNQPKKAPTLASPVVRPPAGVVDKRVPKPVVPVAPPAPPPTVTVDDSDSDDDLLFPEDVTLPPPKVKAVVNTFTTYWDMETDKPILLNPTNEVTTVPPVIEIE